MTSGAANDTRRAFASEIDLLRVQLDCLPYGSALLDEAGRILAENSAWQRFARDERGLAGVSSDYLAIFGGGNREESLLAERGIRDVLAGRRDRFELVYPCHAPTQTRWYRLSACRPHASGPLGDAVALTVMDATEAFIASAHQRIQAGVAKMLSARVPMLDACRKLALSVCHELDWDYTGIWTVDPQRQKLRCKDSWVRPGLELAAFESASRAAALGPGVGLPGRAWISAKAQWATDLDVAQDGESRPPSGRRIMPPSAEQAGFRTAVSFPLKYGAEVLAVVDVFSRRRRSPDAALMELLETAGDQLALWELRERAEESARLAQADADDARARLESVLEYAPAVVLVIGRDHNVQFINHTPPQARKEDVIGKPWLDFVLPAHRARVQTALEQVFAHGEAQSYEVASQDEHDRPRWFLNHMGPIRLGANISGAVVIAQDVTETKLAQIELHDAQRLASVGTLAAGVAHEINTPVQFVNDSIHFLREASADLFGLIEPLRQIKQAVAEGAATGALQDLLDAATAAEERADLDYLREKVPRAFERSAEGLDRVTTIVRSMKEFAHPAQKEMAPTDLNRAIMATLTVARNEYRYVAELETDLGELPPVTCHINDINQVVLNLVVNAAHAIEEVVRGTQRRGVIGVRTRRIGDDAVISISDTGTGIRESVRPRVFDPFFTTKEVGRGTGQGLAIARATVREKHGGDLLFETIVGQGTTFHVRLPIAGKQGGRQAMKRILFVDDEPQILESLRDLLRKQRKEWDMVFATGGEDALAELSKSRFDVVVSDMRMPGIDGAELLTRVKQLCPTAARIILSGHAERDSVVRALPVAHQFLSKPCDAARLRVVVERACELQRLLHDESIRAVIGKLDKLPSEPHTYAELTRAASRPDVAIADLGAIIERDPAMTVKILQLVNSAYFGLPQRLSSVRQAVSYLGADLLKALVLTAHAFGALVPPPIAGFSLERLQSHSLLTARLVKRMVPDRQRAAEAFTAAMVHDVGQIVLAVGVPKSFAEALRLEREEGAPLHVMEKRLIGVTHGEVGAYLLGSWGLPMSIVEAVAYHHTPGLVTGEPPDLLAMLHIANALSHGAAPGAPPSERWLDQGFIAAAGLAEQLPRFRELASDIHEPAGKE